MISNRGRIRTVERKANFNKDILKIPTILNVGSERSQYELIGIPILNSLGKTVENIPLKSRIERSQIYANDRLGGIGAHFDLNSQAGGHLNNRKW